MRSGKRATRRQHHQHARLTDCAAAHLLLFHLCFSSHLTCCCSGWPAAGCCWSHRRNHRQPHALALLTFYCRDSIRPERNPKFPTRLTSLLQTFRPDPANSPRISCISLQIRTPRSTKAVFRSLEEVGEKGTSDIIAHYSIFRLFVVNIVLP